MSPRSTELPKPDLSQQPQNSAIDSWRIEPVGPSSHVNTTLDRVRREPPAFAKAVPKRIHSYFLGGKYPTRTDAGHLYTVLLQMSQIPDVDLKIEDVIKVAGICKTKTRVLLAYLEKEGIIKKRKGIRLVKTFKESDQFENFKFEACQSARAL